ncbi:MAG: methyltransferase [Crocinitomicaceae bacterium]|nr:methyltransferase [Crocinitomicaceae bacterium]
MSVFQFKYFKLEQSNTVHKVGTDALVLAAFVKAKKPKNILDVGCGTGVLSLLMAQKFPDATIHGIDIQEENILLTAKNITNSPFQNRITAQHSSFQSLQTAQSFDLIVCNPPFFKNSTKSDKRERNLARQDDTLSLEDWFFHTDRLLRPEGQSWIIYPIERWEEFEAIRKTYLMHTVAFTKVFGKPNKPIRFIASVSKLASDCTFETFTIRDEEGSYSAAYKEKTMAFHDREL